MSVKSIEIQNVMVFHGKEQNPTNEKPVLKEDGFSNSAFHMNFRDSINVIIGDNGIGKTSVMKMIYAAAQWSFMDIDNGREKKLIQFFSTDLRDVSMLMSHQHVDERSYYTVKYDVHDFTYNLLQNRPVDSAGWAGLNIPSIFIPATEMLSHSRGFLALNTKYNLPFDGTQVDIVMNASLPEANEITPIMTATLEKLSRLIDGTVIQRDDTFYVQKNDGRLVDFSLEAEGYRKFGLLWKLIRNGLLEPGTILLWDEPETNLNPEVYPDVAEIILELANHGVQIFIATHSYNFAKYLEIRRTNENQVLFHNLYRNGSGEDSFYHSSNAVSCDSAYTLEELQENHILMADSKLLDEVYDL